MGLTVSQLQILSKRVANGTLEVEHLLKVAAVGDADNIHFLKALKREHGLSDSEFQGRRRVVPLGRWVDTICRFLEFGYTGLVQMASESQEMSEYCISVLEELRTPESVSALLAIGGVAIEQPTTDLTKAILLAGGINLIMSFKNPPTLNLSIVQQVREFLHKLLEINLSEEQRASVVCALRGVGDEESVTLIKLLPSFKAEWAGLEKTAIKRIRQRLQATK